MYRMNKDNEIANIMKSEKKAMAENKRLRTELQALQVGLGVWWRDRVIYVG